MGDEWEMYMISNVNFGPQVILKIDLKKFYHHDSNEKFITVTNTLDDSVPEVKFCVCYIFASLFCMSKRVHL